MKKYSNEIVFRGHPDKICDQVSAKLLQEYIKQDKHTRAGIECLIKDNQLIVAGEVTSNANIDIKTVAIDVLKDIGVLEADTYEVTVLLSKQSNDIKQGVDNLGAGDNGMMFGYACNDTPQCLPTAQVILQEFASAYHSLVKSFPKNFYADGKAQITGNYDKDFKLIDIDTFTICYQNPETDREFSDNILKVMAQNVASKFSIKINNFLINPTGKFLIGGSFADAGLTGRKIVVDAYQSFANVGGGNMNSKDSTKVDFSGAHKARQLAVEFLKDYGLKWCEVQLSYAIGKAEPLAIYVDSDKGNINVDESYYNDCKPANIIKDLDLLNADYYELAKYGHFR